MGKNDSILNCVRLNTSIIFITLVINSQCLYPRPKKEPVIVITGKFDSQIVDMLHRVRLIQRD